MMDVRGAVWLMLLEALRLDAIPVDQAFQRIT